MPAYVIQKTADALNEAGKPIKGSRVLVLGIAYKKNVDDMRESPSVELMELLREKGADVQYSDPFFATFPRMRRHAFELNNTFLSADVLAGFDAVILATDHDAFDYELIASHSRLMVDTRGRFAPGAQIVRA
jgi:UDP-N-acetyl-D-glucosamine dehydrogenase